MTIEETMERPKSITIVAIEDTLRWKDDDTIIAAYTIERRPLTYQTLKEQHRPAGCSIGYFPFEGYHTVSGTELSAIHVYAKEIVGQRRTVNDLYAEKMYGIYLVTKETPGIAQLNDIIIGKEKAKNAALEQTSRVSRDVRKERDYTVYWYEGGHIEKPCRDEQEYTLTFRDLGWPNLHTEEERTMSRNESAQ
jgi:hypothetical protein